MSQNIRSLPLGSIFYQSGNGVPTHIANKGCTYIDIKTGIEYINKDGLVYWAPFYDAENKPFDIYVTGGSYNYTTGIATFNNNAGGSFSLYGFNAGGGGGGTFTGGTILGATTFLNGLTSTTITSNSVSATTYYNLPKDIFVTGGTYLSGSATFTNNTGGTFNVSGFSTPQLTAVTIDSYSGTRLYPSDSSLNGFGVVKSVNGAIGFNAQNTNTGNGAYAAFNVGGDNSIYLKGASFIYYGSGYYRSELQNTTGIYNNVPFSIVSLNNTNIQLKTGNAFGSETTKLSISSGGTINVATTPSTDNSGSIVGRNSSGDLVLIDKSSAVSGLYLPLSGGTVTGATIFTNGLTANTISATSINRVDYIVFNTGTTIPVTNAGTTFFNNTEHALAYNSSINDLVTVNMGQQLYTRVYNASGSQINKGTVVSVTGTSNTLPSIIKSTNNHTITSARPIGLAAENIPNNSVGLVLNNGILSGITLNNFNNGDTLYLSPFSAGTYVATTSTFPFTARTNEIGYVIQTGTTTGKIYVNINNEDSNLSLTDIERNILEGNVISSGAYQYSGMTQGTGQTINVAMMRGWIVKNTYDYATVPDVTNLYYTGGTNIPLTYLNTADATYILVNSGSTLYQQTTFPTPQQRRENIFLGKVVHPNRSTITSLNQTVDFDVSPMAAIRDLWTPLKLINQGVVVSPHSTTLEINTSAGTLWGNGIGWVTNQANPDSISISGTSPTTFQYRSKLGPVTGATAPYTGNTTFIDPAHYDNNGVITNVGGGSNSSTNQRVYLFPTGLIRIQYGQQVYSSLAAAVAGSQTEQFVEYSNNKDNGILICIISVNKNTTNLSDTTYATFNFVSKFGEIMGGTGGLSTTTLQQAYDNSLTPEIVINSTLDGLSIQNGTGNADATTHLIQGLNTAGNTTSFITANGGFSGSSVSATTYYGNSLILSSSASTINLNNPNQQQIRFFSGGTGAPTYNTYSAGAKIILSDNIDSINSGYAIGVDSGSLWYGANLSGNGHDWYGGTRKLASLIGAGGFQLFGLGGPTTVAMTISGTSSLGSKGGVGYMDFLKIVNNFSGATNPNKFFRTNSTGGLEILRSDYNATILTISDGGIMAVGGGNVATTTSSDGQTNYLSFGNNNTQIYDDGNTHIHSRGANQSMWINTNGGQLNLLTQSPTATGGIGSGIAIATGTLNGYVTINTGRTITTSANYGYLTTGGAGTYPGGSQSVVISLYANSRIWGQEIDAFSDERMKDIEGNITLEDGLNLVNNLKPIKYRWKEGDDKGLKAGYSAQQVIKSGFDHLVSIIPNEGLEETIDDDGFMSPKDTQFSMNYDQVTPYHGVVIKHLLEEIESLKQEINNLKNNKN